MILYESILFCYVGFFYSFVFVKNRSLFRVLVKMYIVDVDQNVPVAFCPEASGFLTL